MTFQDNPAASFDGKVEAVATRKLVATSDANRIVRLLFGSVYLYASLTFAMHMCMTASPDAPRLLTRLALVDGRAVGELALTWAACMVNNIFAGIWISTGAAGQ